MAKNKNNKGYFIVDLDNVLFDTSKLKSYLNSAMRDLVGEEGLADFVEIWQDYYKRRGSLGEFGLEDIFQDFAETRDIPQLYKKVKEIYLGKNFQEFAQRGYRELLLRLKEYGKVIVFTEGFLKFQKKKIKALGLEQILGKENVKVFTQKEKHTPKILKKAEPFKKVVVIDDKAKVIGKFEDEDPSVVGVWVRYGYHKEKNSFDLPSSQYEIRAIDDLDQSLLDKVLGVD